MHGIKNSTCIGAENTPHTKHKREKLENHWRSIQQIFEILHAPRSPLGKDPGVDECVPTPVTENGTALSLSLQTLCGVLIDVRSFLNYNAPACERLVRRRFNQQEFPSLIDAVLSSNSGGEMIRSLSTGDAQMLIDVMDEVHSMVALHHKSAYWIYVVHAFG